MSNMRKLLTKTTIAVLLLTVTLSLLIISKAEAENPNRLSSEFSIDNSGIYCAQKSGSRLRVQQIYPEQSDYTYDLDEPVIDYRITSGTAYALTSSQSNRSVTNVYRLKNGNVRKIEIRDFDISAGNAEIAADSDGLFYIIKPNGIVTVFGSDGQIITDTAQRYQSLTVCGAKVYGINHKGLFRLGKSTEKSVLSLPPDTSAVSISDNAFIDNNGNIITLSGDSFNLGCGKMVACLSDCYVGYKNGGLIAFDRETHEQYASAATEITPAAMFGYKNKLVLIYESGSRLTYKTYGTDIFRQETISPTEKADKENPSAKLSFGGYDVRGKYIYVPPRTTRSSFKKAICCDGYEIKFEGKHTAHIGTGLKLVLSGASDTKKYTFILPADVNGTGTVNNSDIYIMMDYVLDLEELKGEYKIAADMNRDGRITNADLVLADRKRLT